MLIIKRTTKNKEKATFKVGDVTIQILKVTKDGTVIIGIKADKNIEIMRADAINKEKKQVFDSQLIAEGY